MRDKRCFVQFIHPGGEHQPDSPGHKGWNVEPHRRKFLRSPGRYIADGQEREGQIVFWGEWEAESRVAQTFETPLPGEPHYLYEPYLVPPTSDEWRQNTDPFVFGDEFRYTGCLQHAAQRPTQLRNLKQGSLVLFGSCMGRSRFVIDTVFVVDTSLDHGPDDYPEKLNGVIDETYQLATINPVYAGELFDGQTFRMYSGATPIKPIDGMFSFFPCLPVERESRGFPRPSIELPELITPQLLQGKKIARDVAPSRLKSIWDQVVSQVEAQGLALGVHAELPPISSRSAAPEATRTSTRRKC